MSQELSLSEMQDIVAAKFTDNPGLSIRQSELLPQPIVNGVLVVSRRLMSVIPENGALSGTLTDMQVIPAIDTGGADGYLVILRPGAGVTVTVATSGNIHLKDGTPVVLNGVHDYLQLLCDPLDNEWYDLRRS